MLLLLSWWCEAGVIVAVVVVVIVGMGVDVVGFVGCCHYCWFNYRPHRCSRSCEYFILLRSCVVAMLFSTLILVHLFFVLVAVMPISLLLVFIDYFYFFLKNFRDFSFCLLFALVPSLFVPRSWS